MEPVLFADHLRRMRKTLDENSQPERPAFDLAGAGRVLGAACAGCLLLVMLQAALSAPAPTLAGPQIAAVTTEEAAR